MYTEITNKVFQLTEKGIGMEEMRLGRSYGFPIHVLNGKKLGIGMAGWKGKKMITSLMSEVKIWIQWEYKTKYEITLMMSLSVNVLQNIIYWCKLYSRFIDVNR